MPRKRNPIPQGVRFDVFRRDNFTCVYCGRSSPDVVLHCDHQLAHSKGGGDDVSNLVTACSDCNQGKSAKDVYISTSPRLPDRAAGLVGLFGHTRHSDGEINWQFEVIGKVDEGEFSIQLYSWIDGLPTDIKLLTIEEIRACSLYATRSAWIAQWERERKPYQRKAA